MSRERRLMVGVFFVAGPVAVGFGWVMAGREFVPSLLLQVGTGVLLLGVLLVIEVRLEREILNLKQSVEDQGTTLASLRLISRDLVSEQYHALFEMLATWETALTHQSVWSLLGWSQSTGTISADGIRVYLPGPGPDRWIRLKAEGTAEHPRVVFSVEAADGAREATYEWPSNHSPEDAVHDLFATIRTTAVEWTAFDASWIFERALVPIRVGMEAHLRFPERNIDIGSIVEVPNTQWAITDLGLECTTRFYPIHWWRLWESNWSEHVSRKGWVIMEDFLVTYHHALGYFAGRRGEARMARATYESDGIA